MPIIKHLYFSEYGEGRATIPPVLLIHGAGSSQNIWLPKIRRLRGFRTIALDLPGHGKSGGTACQSIDAFAREVLSFLDGLGLYHIILVGHSMGGAVALTIALQQPDIVEALGLISSGAAIGVPPDVLDNLSNPRTVPIALDILKKSAFSPRTSQRIIDKTMQGLQSVRQGVLYSDWLACSRYDLRHQVNRIRTPTWVAVGSDDGLTPLSYARYLATNIPNVHVQVVPDAGHMLILEQPDAVAFGLNQFLGKLFSETQNKFVSN